MDALEEAVNPYLFFWKEWTNNGNCNLSATEVLLIEKLIENGFRIDFIDLLLNNNNQDMIATIVKKLCLGYQVFKDFVIVNFLQTIVVLARTNGYDNFLQTPIRQLNLEECFKDCLLKFKCHTLQLVFMVYKAEDFNRAWLYAVIEEFQTLRLMQNQLTKLPENVFETLKR